MCSGRAREGRCLHGRPTLRGEWARISWLSRLIQVRHPSIAEWELATPERRLRSRYPAGFCRGSRSTSCNAGPTVEATLLVGQFLHACHLQIARRAILPHACGVAQNPKSVACRLVPRSIRGALRDRHECRVRDAMDVPYQLTSDVARGRRSRVVLAPLGWR